MSFSIVTAILLIWTCLAAGGCNSLPPGDLNATRTAVPLTRHGEVFLLRGWRGLYSTGIDDLAKELESQGVRATVYRETQWSDLAAPLAERFHDRPADGPLVLIGFSFGADNVVALSRKLQKLNCRVPLLITIDPVTPDDVPDNVDLCYNFYQSNGAMDAIPAFRGIPLHAEKNAAVKLTNINIHEHVELENPAIGHRTIAGYAKVHAAILSKVMQSCPPLAASGPTTLPAR